jgi:predicted NUDIX family NTP pyrophosphohydrolase
MLHNASSWRDRLRGDFISLGDAKQAGGKIVLVFAMKNNRDATDFQRTVSKCNCPQNPAGYKAFLGSTR